MNGDWKDYKELFTCPLVYITFGLFIASLGLSLLWEDGKFIAMVCGLSFIASILIYIFGGGYK